MEPENPYTPPKGEISALDPNTPITPKRPKSHKVLIAIFAITIAFRAFLHTKIATPSLLETIEMFYPIIPFVALVGFRLSRATYYIVSASLLLFIVPGSWVAIRMVVISNKYGPGIMIPQLIGGTIVVYLLGLLGWKYIFGKPSRAYYGFPVR